ncbi:MAG: hypothetical protein KAG84_02935 [Bacteroidales bacterium]|nr:hypothetical protein [Bacteroidales bacterium]
MDPKVIFGLSMLAILIIAKILSSKKKIKKNISLKDFLFNKNKAPFYDGVFGFASVFIITPFIDNITSEMGVLFYTSISIALIIMYVSSKISRFIIQKNFYNRLPMFY